MTDLNYQLRFESKRTSTRIVLSKDQMQALANTVAEMLAIEDKELQSLHDIILCRRKVKCATASMAEDVSTVP